MIRSNLLIKENRVNRAAVNSAKANPVEGET